jgi:5-methyltetrahydrofolate--homocysteine methyltransferase
MVHFARELGKHGMSVPLLIGGATTSRMHTAVKIAPQYTSLAHPVIHVLDASRSVTVVSSLLDVNKDRREAYVQDVLDLYEVRRASLSRCKFSPRTQRSNLTFKYTPSFLPPSNPRRRCARSTMRAWRSASFSTWRRPA